jgi:hypothetical protein
MNDLEQTEEKLQDSPIQAEPVQDSSSEDNADKETVSAETPAQDASEQDLSEENMSPVETPSEEVMAAPRARRAPKTRAPKKNASKPATRPQRNPNIFRHIVTVSWSGAREPVDDMFWAEAESDGAWIVVSEFEKIRTRKEVLDRLMDLEVSPEKPCLVAFDFNFSYPTQFFELLNEKDGISDWRGMISQVREDLKKNMDDGLRLWVERLGRYRESRLETAPTEDDRGRERAKKFGDWGWDFKRESPAPHEQRSLAERYRRTDFPLRMPAGANLMSTMNIAYNRLTSRYEFTGNEKRGRAALAGMSMLDRLLDARPNDAAVWPMAIPKPLTIVEVLPWLYTDGETLNSKKLTELLQNYEDFGWDISSHARDLATKNADAQRALLTLLGMIKTELRSDHRRRPLRDYDRSMYDDGQVKLEGWIYGLGYRPRSESERDGEQNHSENLPELENKPARKPKKIIASVKEESLVIAD